MKQQNAVRTETLKKVLSRIGKYKWLVLLSLCMAAAVVALTLYVPVLTGDAVDLIVGKGLVDFAGLLKILVKIGVAVGLTALLQWLMGILNNRITYRTVRDLRNEAFRRIDGSLDRAELAGNGRQIFSGTNGICLYHLYVSGFEHDVGGGNARGNRFEFNHSKRFFHVSLFLFAYAFFVILI